MASAAYLATLLARFPQAEREDLKTMLEALLRDLRLGQPEAGVRAPGGNFQLYPVEGTTHATPGTEFSIEHGLGRAPYLAVPVLPLNTEGAQMVPLTVSRVADANRVYFTSTIASAPITLYLEV